MDAKMLKEFKESLEKAVSLLNTRGDQIDGLMDNFEKMERSIIAMKADMASPVSGHLGFIDQSTAKNFVGFCSAVFNENRQDAKAMSEGVDADGGYLVPQEFRAVLLRIVEVYGIVRPQATVVPMSREEMNVPALSTGVSVYWPDEGATINSSVPAFGNLRLVAKKMAALCPVTNELMEDSAIPIANLLATLFGEAVAKEEDRIALTGDAGNGDPFDGLLHSNGVVEVNMAGTGFGDITADALADMTVAVSTSAAAGAKFYLHRTIFNVVRKLKDSSGAYIYQAPAGDQPGTIWGYPYELVDVMPSLTDSGAEKPFVAFGNLRHIHFGDRRNMTIARSQHYGFANDLTYLRVVERIAIETGIPAAFSRLVTAAAA